MQDRAIAAIGEWQLEKNIDPFGKKRFVFS